MKKNIVIIVLIVLAVLFINTSSARAFKSDEEFNTTVDGVYSGPSDSCTSFVCGNSIGLFSYEYEGDKSNLYWKLLPIFGIKVTLYKPDGYSTGKSAKFFPSQKIADIYTTKTKTNNNHYVSGLFYEGRFVDKNNFGILNNMYGCTYDELNNVVSCTAQVDYRKIIEEKMLSSENARTNMENIYNKIGSYNGKSFDTILSDGYFYVIQPVFIFHVTYGNNGYVHPLHLYYYGTIQDVIFDLLMTSGNTYDHGNHSANLDSPKNNDSNNLKYNYNSTNYSLSKDSSSTQVTEYTSYYDVQKCNSIFNDNSNKNFSRSLSFIHGGTEGNTWCTISGAWNVLGNYIQNPQISQTAFNKSDDADKNAIRNILGMCPSCNNLAKYGSNYESGIDAIRNKSSYGKAIISLRKYASSTKVVVNKYKGTSGTNCYDKAVTFELRKSGSSTSYATKTKAAGCGSIVFDNVPEGHYSLIEKDASGNDTVIFKIGTKSYGQRNSPTSDAWSDYFPVTKGSTITVNVWNSSLTDECINDVKNMFNSFKSDAARSYKLIDLYKNKYNKFSSLINFNKNSSIMSKSSLTDDDAKNLCKKADLGTSSNALSCTGSSTYYVMGDNAFINGDSASYIANNNSIRPSDLGSNTYCYLGMNYNFNFKESTVLASQVLWKNDLGNLNATLHCEGFYNFSHVSYSSYSNNIKSVISPFLSNMKVKWKTGPDGKLISYEQNISPKLNTVVINGSAYGGDSNPKVNPVEVNSGEGFVHVKWDVTYKYDLYYDKDNCWYSQIGSRKFITYSDYVSVDPKDKGKYKYIGYGLPIATDESSGTKQATITFGSLSANCPYIVNNKILCPPDECPPPSGKTLSTEFNFKFRVIDFTKPFAGLDGSNTRLTGHNWCVSSRIGTVVYDDDNMLLVGDLDGNGEIDNNDLKGKTDFENNLLVGDINGDGVITYATNCAGDPLTDNCILSNYLSNNGLDCAADNSIVGKYILNAKSSQSTDLPMYRFTLTSTEIRAIRTYNSIHSYNDFNLTCDDGEKCKSDFISNWINDKKIVASNGFGFYNSTNITVSTDSSNSSCYATRSGTSGKWCSNN